MITFDQAHVYQFSLFFDDQSEPSAEALQQLPALLSRQVTDVPLLGMKLGPAEGAQAFVVQASGALAPSGVQSWKAGSGIWRIVWTPSRLDIHFDARGYADLLDAVPVARVAQRVVPNLSQVPLTLGQRVNRLALIVTGQATCGGGEPRPSHVVAETFFRPSIVDTEHRGELGDAIGRTNHIGKWRFNENGVEVRVNRNETGTATIVVRNGAEEMSLAWQWDVNTSGATVAATNFDAASIVSFFQRAEAWIKERSDVLQGIR